MHLDLPPSSSPEPISTKSGPWWRELNSYHWFVLLVAALGWLFDTMDQQLFALARAPAMKALVHSTPDESSKSIEDRRNIFGALSTTIFMLGWATGGLAFGVLGDRVGRAKVMLWTILLYSAFTGLSALSVSVWDFSLYRFLTGLGVGGEFAVGVSLVAEVMPQRARPFALGLLQALSAVGNISAALITMSLGQLEEGEGLKKLSQFTGIEGLGSSWRVMFLIGTLPALLALFIRRRLKEPERWQAMVKSGGANLKIGGLKELFADARWRKNAIVGLLLGFSGVVGLWGIGFFSFDLLRKVFKDKLTPGQITFWLGISSVMQNLGGFLGIYVFSWATQYIGRRWAFAIAFVAAALSTAGTFWFISELSHIFWMIPIMGFCQLSLFGGYAIYFPELFPTRLRSTGTSFCYNVGRYVAAIGVLMQGVLSGWLLSYSGQDESMPLRYAGVAMCSVFLIGLLALPFAEETMGKPLPE